MLVETVPYIAKYGRTSKAHLADGAYVVGGDAAKGNHLLVYNAALGGRLQLFKGEMAQILLLGYTVEDGTHEDVVEVPLLLLHLLQRVARAADVPLVVEGDVGIAAVQVYAHQAELLLQVEVVVGDDALVILSGDKRQQPLRQHGSSVRLPQVQYIQTLLEE